MAQVGFDGPEFIDLVLHFTLENVPKAVKAVRGTSPESKNRPASLPRARAEVSTVARFSKPNMVEIDARLQVGTRLQEYLAEGIHQ